MTVRRVAVRAVPAAAVVVAASCGQPPPTRAVVVRDSGGVRIVENFRPEWSDRAECRVDSEPLLVLNGFADVTDVALLDGGAVVVLDGMAHELRFFDAEGRLLASVGREGSGPGAFAAPVAVDVYRGDSVVVFDRALGRISVFSAAGRFARGVPVRIAAQRLAFVGALDDGSFVVRAGGFEPHTGTWREPAAFVRIAPDGGARDTLAVVPGQEFYTIHFQGRPVYGLRPFGRQALATTIGDGVILNLGDGCALVLLAPTGRSVMEAHAPCERRSLPGGAIEEFERARIAGMRVRSARDFVSAIYRTDKVPYPEHVPPYDRLSTDATGYLWAGRYPFAGDTLRVWSLFRLNGRLMGTVTTPPGLEVRSIRAGLLAGVARDGEGRPRVELYRVLRPSTAWRTGVGGSRSATPTLIQLPRGGYYAKEPDEVAGAERVRRPGGRPAVCGGE
ncbi:MAG: hypothetical protein PVF27_06330 [Gemmatimonadales bacterium]